MGDSKDIAKLSIPARYFFTLFLCWLDDEGRAEWAPKFYSGVMYAHDNDVSAQDVQGWMEECVSAGLLCSYEVGGQAYVHAPNFLKHQKVESPKKSEYPEPPRDSPEGSETHPQGIPDTSPKSPRSVPEASPTSPRDIPDASPTGEGEGEGEGKGINMHAWVEPHFDSVLSLPACSRCLKANERDWLLDRFRLTMVKFDEALRQDPAFPGWDEVIDHLVNFLSSEPKFGKNSTWSISPAQVLQDRLKAAISAASGRAKGQSQEIDFDAIAAEVAKQFEDAS